jgi:hypothetical protein
MRLNCNGVYAGDGIGAFEFCGENAAFKDFGNHY